MTQEEWIDFVEKLVRQYPVRLRQGVTDSDLADAQQATGEFPEDLHTFYRVTNGLLCEWFNLLPIERDSEVKGTWDGLRRANDASKTKFFTASKDLLDRFLIFADIGGGHCACFDRQDDSIWVQDSDGLHQTDLTLSEFIETTAREVAEL